VSSAKRAVDSTIRRILKYTSEIIISIVLLILLSLPLAFAVPMWIQEVVFDVPSSNLIVNPIAWFGVSATFGLTIALGIFSFFLGYLFMHKITPSTRVEKESTSKIEETVETEEDMSSDENEIEEPTGSIEEEEVTPPDESETE
jgi:hypothetical protein